MSRLMRELKWLNKLIRLHFYFYKRHTKSPRRHTWRHATIILPRVTNLPLMINSRWVKHFISSINFSISIHLTNHLFTQLYKRHWWNNKPFKSVFLTSCRLSRLQLNSWLPVGTYKSRNFSCPTEILVAPGRWLGDFASPGINMSRLYLRKLI